MSDLAVLRIEQSDYSPSSWRVWLNGIEITRQCKAVAAYLDSDGLTMVTLEMYVESINARPDAKGN